MYLYVATIKFGWTGTEGICCLIEINWLPPHDTFRLAFKRLCKATYAIRCTFKMLICSVQYCRFKFDHLCGVALFTFGGYAKKLQCHKTAITPAFQSISYWKQIWPILSPWFEGVWKISWKMKSKLFRNFNWKIKINFTPRKLNPTRQLEHPKVEPPPTWPGGR